MNEKEIESKVNELHSKFSNLSLEELCEVYLAVVKIKPDPKLLKIIKTYIARNINSEGIF